MREQYTFSQVPRADIPRSVFNRHHTHKTTFDAGYLIPFYVDEALPGDTFNVRASLFARLATPIVPLMDNLYMDVFFFAVPNRLVWDNWQKFCGEQINPGDSTDFTIPQMLTPAAGYSVGTIQDYMGLPIGIAAGTPAWSVSALWRRAYYRIWNEWFRDENLQNSDIRGTDTGDGPVAPGPGGDSPLRRGKRHDYFTSCLPWPQKGPGVTLPLGSSAPVIPSGVDSGPYFKSFSGGSGTADNAWLKALTASPTPGIAGQSTTGTFAVNDQLVWDVTGLVADLSNATAATINSLRQAFQVQKLLERDARGGTRYVELLKSHFGVTSPDARLQRPEFLGGGSLPVVINPVVQNSGTPPDLGTGYTATPQGNLSAFGVVGGTGIGFSKSFVEHTLLIGLISVRADYTYQYGINRMWSRKTRYDFYWPALSHLGEQAVLTKEIFMTGIPATDETVFGYQERWAEYRYHPSLITGQFRSVYPQTLDVWHLAQEFIAPPQLNDTFIVEDPPVARVIAVPSEPHFLFDSSITIRSARPMPLYSVPGWIDHF